MSLEVRGWQSEARGQKLAVYKKFEARLRGVIMQAGGWRPEVGGQRLEAGGQRLEVTGWRLEAGGMRHETRGLRLMRGSGGV